MTSVQKSIFWILIAAFVFFTRFYKLDSVPPSLTIDEVSIGYNAYSILKTGRDEWGTFMPVSFRSVGDYKAPTLIYLTVPFIKLFGLNEWGTRLPVAIFSTLNILLFWILVKRFIFSKEFPLLPFLATLVFSLSPWLVPFSRSGFEAIVALTFLLANLIFAFEFRKTGRLIHFFFMFLFAYLSAITYHSTKIVVPVLNICFIGLDFKFFKSSISSWLKVNRPAFMATFLLFIVITIFFVQNFIFGSGSSRASMTILSKDFDFAKGLLPQYLPHPFAGFTSFVGLVSLWFKRYLEYFSPNFYLTSGLGLVTPGQPGQGVIYAMEYPFLVLGFISLIFRTTFIKNVISSRYITSVLLVWFFLSLVPASITNNSQHALRTLNIVPVITILISLGITYVSLLIQKAWVRHLFGVLIVSGYIFGLIRFTDYYSLHYPVELSETRSYGWKQMAIYARDHHSEYDNIYIDPRFGTQGPYTYGIPNTYFLFYMAYDPGIYVYDAARMTMSTDFENFKFLEINWPDFDHSKNNLYIASPWSIPVELIGSKKQRYYVPFLNNSSGLYAISDR